MERLLIYVLIFLCGVGISFLGLCFTLDFIKVWWLCVPLWKFSMNLICIETGDSKYNAFGGIGNQYVGMGITEVYEGFHRREVSRVFHWDLFILFPLSLIRK